MSIKLWVGLGVAGSTALGSMIWAAALWAAAPKETATASRVEPPRKIAWAGPPPLPVLRAAPQTTVERIRAAMSRRAAGRSAQQLAAPTLADPHGGFAMLTAWDGFAAPQLQLGPNQDYAPYLIEASRRTGLSAETLAALIDAEAAKGASGRWDPRSAHRKSSARGVAQFLESTWLAEAAKHGRALRIEGRSRGLLDDRGRPRDEAARAAFLELRYEPRLAIIAAAEMAAANLLRLAEEEGHAPKDDREAARLAYLAHHAGYYGAKTHLEGGATAERAAARLAANLGSERVKDLLAAHEGAPSKAYAAWLEGYIAQRVRPERFQHAVAHQSLVKRD